MSVALVLVTNPGIASAMRDRASEILDTRLDAVTLLELDSGTTDPLPRLEQRLRSGNWQQLLEGDPESEPSGPLFGDDACGAGEPLAGRELAFAGNYPHFMALFRATRMQPARRALAVKPLNCALDYDGDSALLAFTLPRGAFATAILNELFIIEDDAQTS